MDTGRLYLTSIGNTFTLNQFLIHSTYNWIVLVVELGLRACRMDHSDSNVFDLLEQTKDFYVFEATKPIATFSFCSWFIFVKEFNLPRRRRRRRLHADALLMGHAFQWLSQSVDWMECALMMDVRVMICLPFVRLKLILETSRGSIPWDRPRTQWVVSRGMNWNGRMKGLEEIAADVNNDQELEGLSKLILRRNWKHLKLIHFLSPASHDYRSILLHLQKRG